MTSRINMTGNKEIKNHGDVQIFFNTDGQSCYFGMICPKCKDLMYISNHHTKTIDSEGELTISPSLIHKKCGSHFFVTKNEIILIE